MLIKCPNCGNTCEVDGELPIGQHMVCPFCSEKFSYSGIEQENEFNSQDIPSDETIHNGIAIKCPHCGTEYEVDENADGAIFQCGVCNKDFVVNIGASERGDSALADRLKKEPVKNVIEAEKLGNNIKDKNNAVALWKRVTKIKKPIVLITVLCVVVIVQFFAVMILLTRHGMSGGVQTSVVNSLPPGTPSELLLKYAEEGEISYVEAVLKQNPALDVNRPRTAGNKTALYIACEKGYTDIVKLLLDRKADATICDTETPTLFSGVSQFSPLTVAAKNGHLDVVKVLLAHGVDVESRDAADRTALYAAMVNNKPEIVQFLCESKAEINIYRKKEWTPLTAAAKEGNVEVIKTLLKYGKGIDLEMRGGSPQATPLYHAVENNHPEVVEVLCTAKAKVNIYCDNNTPLTAAAKKGYAEVIEILLKYGEKIDLEMTPSTSSYSRTPLWYAATWEHGHPKAVEVLCSAGANVNYYYYNIIDKRCSLLSDVTNPEVIEILKKWGAKY